MDSACIHNRAPMVKKSTLAPTKMTVNVAMFFCASFKLRHAKFFCIMSWSSPVMAMVTNIPARMCLTQWLFRRQSSVTQIWVNSVEATTSGNAAQL